MAQTNTGKLQATINENGETVYQAPIEIKSDADLENYGITREDCRTLHFGKSEKIIVYYFPTTNRRFVEEQWRYLNTQHSKGYRSMRCMVRDYAVDSAVLYSFDYRTYVSRSPERRNQARRSPRSSSSPRRPSSSMCATCSRRPSRR